MLPSNLCKSVFTLVTLSIILSCTTTKKGVNLNKERTIAALDDLKSGVLLIRVTSSERKINALQSAYEGSQNSNQKRAIKVRIAETVNDRDSLLHTLQKSFRADYTLSRVAFVWDSDFLAFKNGQYGEVRLPFSTSDIAAFRNGDFVMLCVNTNNKKEDGIFLNNQFERLAPPFPRIKQKPSLKSILVFLERAFGTPKKEFSYYKDFGIKTQGKLLECRGEHNR